MAESSALHRLAMPPGVRYSGASGPGSLYCSPATGDVLPVNTLFQRADRHLGFGHCRGWNPLRGSQTWPQT